MNCILEKKQPKSTVQKIFSSLCYYEKVGDPNYIGLLPHFHFRILILFISRKMIPGNNGQTCLEQKNKFHQSINSTIVRWGSCVICRSDSPRWWWLKWVWTHSKQCNLHKSYGESLLISSLCESNQLARPFIIAGPPAIDRQRRNHSCD